MTEDTTLPLYVQFGCGNSAPTGWRNFDASPTLTLQRLPMVGKYLRHDKISFPANVEFGDVRKGLPVPDQSCAGVYASHVLEHLALVDFEKALRETYRILRPGGRFRLLVPDLAYYCDAYLQAHRNGDPEACHNFMRGAHLGYDRRASGVIGAWLASISNSRHMWMWDFAGMSAALTRHGFTDIREAVAGDSPDPAFLAAENPDRFLDACAIECQRPLN